VYVTEASTVKGLPLSGLAITDKFVHCPEGFGVGGVGGVGVGAWGGACWTTVVVFILQLPPWDAVPLLLLLVVLPLQILATGLAGLAGAAGVGLGAVEGFGGACGALGVALTGFPQLLIIAYWNAPFFITTYESSLSLAKDTLGGLV
jgi:hypothetical protein